MKVKGIAIVPVPKVQVEGSKVAVMFDDATMAELGQPGEGDTIMAFTTRHPGFHEVVCFTGIPKECSDPAHLVEAHMEEIELAIRLFRLQTRKH